jgi:hypothetical protein
MTEAVFLGHCNSPVGRQASTLTSYRFIRDAKGALWVAPHRPSTQFSANNGQCFDAPSAPAPVSARTNSSS